MNEDVIILKKVHVSTMLSFLTKSDVKDRQIIDLRHDKIICRGFPFDFVSYIKHMEINVKDSVELEDGNLDLFVWGKGIPDGYSNIKIPTVKLSKIRDVFVMLENSGTEYAEIKIPYEKSGSDDSLVGITFNIKSKNIKNIKIDLLNISFAKYMSDEKFNNFHDINEQFAKMSLSPIVLNQLKKVSAMDFTNMIHKNNKTKETKDEIMLLLDINPDENSICFQSSDNNQWQLEYNDNDGLSLEITDHNSIPDNKLLIPRQLCEVLDPNCVYELYFRKFTDQYIVSCINTMDDDIVLFIVYEED
jgi:hypothetical protein